MKRFGLLTRLLRIRMLVELPFGAEAADLAAYLRAAMPMPERRGASTSVSWTIDLMIAAVAAEHGHAIVSYNIRDFDLIAVALPAPLRLPIMHPSVVGW